MSNEIKKDPKRSAAAKKGWETRRLRQQSNKSEEKTITDRITKINPKEIRKLSKSELLELTKSANRAISIREKEFRTKYAQRMGVEEAKKFDFNREKFDVDENSSMGKLRHTLRMQQKYLARKNDWESYVKSAKQFEKRLKSRANIRMDGVDISGDQDDRVETIVRYEDEVDTSWTLKKEIERKNRFFQLYNKALELRNSGSKESKGSPIFAEVAEIMLENPDITDSVFELIIQGNYEEAELERIKQSSGEIETEDFFSKLKHEDSNPKRNGGDTTKSSRRRRKNHYK